MIVNTRGIPCIENTGNTTTATAVTYNFNRTDSRGNFSGLIAVKIITPSLPETAVPVQFTVPGVSGSTIPVTAAGGTQALSSAFTEGVHLVFYDRFSNNLQLIV